MLYYAAMCFVVAIVSALMGFGGVLINFAEIPKALSVIALVLFFVSLFRGLYEGGPARESA